MVTGEFRWKALMILLRWWQMMNDQKLTSVYECPDGSEFSVEWEDAGE